mmetsp:Transcript_34276/g.87843  ORF Transcript_34276/g.87843 Transcript_34276/m.87843 type:complete len:113 (-) Transcript_34276:532-870(-)
MICRSVAQNMGPDAVPKQIPMKAIRDRVVRSECGVLLKAMFMVGIVVTPERQPPKARSASNLVQLLLPLLLLHCCSGKRSYHTVKAMRQAKPEHKRRAKRPSPDRVNDRARS